MNLVKEFLLLKAKVDKLYCQLIAKSSDEQDPTVPNHVKTIKQEDIDNWNNIKEEEVQITEDTAFAQIGQSQKDFNKSVSDYKTNSDLKNQEQDDRLTNIEGDNTAQYDLINDLNSELDSERARNDAQDSRLENLEGINYTWSPTNRTLTLFDNNGTQLSQISLVSLDNEGTDIRYNASTLSLELYNADNELLDSIPVSSFIGSVGTQLQLNSNQLQLKDSQGNILSTVSFSIVNIPGLQTALDSKLNKGSFPGNASDLKTEIDGKLNKPTTTSTTTSYPYVVGEDGNGNSARLPAGDLGKNFFNSDLSNTTARNHTMNASVTVNTLGNPHTLAGLPNKNTDIANFRKVRVQNVSGLDAVVDSKNLLTDGVTSMTDAEKDAWRLAQRKSTETYSTGVPVVNGVYPYIQSKENVSFLNFTITGSSLLINILNPQTKILFTRTHDINGQSVSEPKYDATGNVNISLITANNISLEVPAVNLNTGKYVVEVVHNNLTSLVTSEFYIHTSIIQQSLPAITIAQSLGSTSQYLQESTLGTNNTTDAFMFKTSEILNMANYPNGVVIELNITLFTKQYAGNSHTGYVYLSSTADAITASPAIGSLGIYYACNGNGTSWTDFGSAGVQGGSFPLTIIIKGGYAQLVTSRLGYVQIINKSNIFNGGISLNIGTGGFNSYTSPIFKVSLVSIKKIMIN